MKLTKKRKKELLTLIIKSEVGRALKNETVNWGLERWLGCDQHCLLFQRTQVWIPVFFMVAHNHLLLQFQRIYTFFWFPQTPGMQLLPEARASSSAFRHCYSTLCPVQTLLQPSGHPSSDGLELRSRDLRKTTWVQIPYPATLLLVGLGRAIPWVRLVPQLKRLFLWVSKETLHMCALCKL